jgi:alanine racemase
MTISPTLEVNVSALRSNYRLLKNQHAGNSIAAVVKANAYGLGVGEVGVALWADGCRDFFVATLEEGIELRKILPEVRIGVFQGLFAGEEQEFSYHRLVPVLNDISQIERFVKSELRHTSKQIMVHVDTGMTRLGLSETDLKNPVVAKLQSFNQVLLLSHLACANTPAHPKNSEQLERFNAALKYFPDAKTSLANSAGIFLPPEFHCDIARPGCALYGINPGEEKNPMQHVATLSAPILQIRELDREETVGYGATAPASRGSRIAIVALGYADGYFRSLSNQGFAYVAGHKVPLLGRVSMDMVALDVSAIPEREIGENSRAEFINELQMVDDIAAQCGTIGYEIFTRIGRRIKRVYK